MARRHSLETIFAEQAAAAGFIVEQAGSIRIDQPVENYNGKKGKVVTNPDFFVINPENNQGVYVEIGNGKNNQDNGHKAAQMRVVEKAGVENYVQLTGHQIHELQEAKTNQEIKSLLINMLYLVLTC